MPAVKPKQEIDRPAAAHGNPGLTASDITLERMSLLHKVSKVMDHEDNEFKPGDIVIGDGQSPDDLTRVYVRGNKDGVRFAVLAVYANLQVKFGQEGGPWEVDDPEAPADARTSYHYTLAIPSHDDEFPVRFTMSGTAARVARKINKALYTQCEKGPIYGVFFELHTEQTTRGDNTWTTPVVKAVEPTDHELAAAEELFARVTPRNRAVASLPAGEGSGPAY